MLAPFVAAAAVAAAVPAPFAGGSATPICGSRSIPFQQQALASSGDSVWVACRDGARLVRVRAATGARVRTVRLGGFRPWAVTSGFGALWAIDRDLGELRRLDARTGRRRARIALPGLPVALWAGAGSVWVGFENGTRVARVDPRTRRVRLIAAGDGASGFATDGRSVFVTCHRDNVLTRIDLATNRSIVLVRGLTPPERTAAERIAFADGSLWVTGRGLDLLRVNPASGSFEATIDVGPGRLRGPARRREARRRGVHAARRNPRRPGRRRPRRGRPEDEPDRSIEARDENVIPLGPDRPQRHGVGRRHGPRPADPGHTGPLAHESGRRESNPHDQLGRLGLYH